MEVLVLKLKLQIKRDESISDAVSSRERKRRDVVSLVTGYSCLSSRSFVRTNNLRHAINSETNKAKIGTVAHSPGRTLILNDWRDSDLMPLLMLGRRFSPFKSLVQLKGDSLFFFCNEMTICSVHEFMEFVPQLLSQDFCLNSSQNPVRRWTLLKVQL